MTTAHRIARSWLLACAAIACASACRDEADATDLFVAASEELNAARCACGGSSVGCDSDRLLSACEERVVRRHQDGIGSWIECAARAIHAEAECVERSGCAEERLESCRVEPEDRCGRPPDGTTLAIQQQIEELCEQTIECDDGSTEVGAICDGDRDCRDGSDELGCEDEPAGGPVVVPPPPVSSATFVCSDGSAIAIDAVCDDLTDCPLGEDESPCFTCSNGARIRVALTCDRIFDCVEGSDEQFCPPSAMPAAPSIPPTVPPPPPDVLSSCLELADQVPGIDQTCVQCACTVAPMEASICDATCWQLIGCAAERCAGFAPDDPSLTTCVAQSCPEFLSGAMPATVIAPILRSSCAMACPPL